MGAKTVCVYGAEAVNQSDASIPEFRSDGYLPEGMHACTLPEAVFRFGTGSRQRKRLVRRLRRWVELARGVSATRLFINGSFVTSKQEPNDIDAVLLLPTDFLNN